MYREGATVDLSRYLKSRWIGFSLLIYSSSNAHWIQLGKVFLEAHMRVLLTWAMVCSWRVLSADMFCPFSFIWLGYTLKWGQDFGLWCFFGRRSAAKLVLNRPVESLFCSETLLQLRGFFFLTKCAKKWLGLMLQSLWKTGEITPGDDLTYRQVAFMAVKTYGGTSPAVQWLRLLFPV